MVSVCLCDPQPVVQQGLEGLLERNGDFALLESSDRLVGVSTLAQRNSPDVLIVDRSYGMHAVLEALAELKQSAPSVYIVVWASTISDVECFRLLQAGARGVLKKTVSPEAIFHCLQCVAQNAIWTEDLFHASNAQPQPTRSRPLTPREGEVAALVSKGMKNREIAESLGIATGTVKIHLMHIFEKTGMRDRFELALRGLRTATDRDRGATPATEQVPSLSRQN
jgi:two-component system nitrate/nitrite response regulator NarL